MPDTCPSCGNEKTWEHDALCFDCLPTQDAQRKVNVLRNELDRVDQLLRQHLHHVERLQERRRAVTQRLQAWETLAEGAANVSPEDTGP